MASGEEPRSEPLAEPVGYPNRLREHRRAAELTQDQVAERLSEIAWKRYGRSITPSRELISQFERGAKRVSRFYRSLFCELYGVTPDDLGLRPPPPPRARSTYPLNEWSFFVNGESEEVRRREFVTLLGAIALEILDPERLAVALGIPADVDERLLEDLETLSREYERRYWTVSPTALWPAIRGQVAITRRLHRMAAPAIRRRAAGLASRSATLLGLLCHRLGRRPESVMYLALARELAAEAQDGPLQAHALVALRAAYSPVTADEPGADAEKALALLDEAERVGQKGAPPLLLTWLYACRAEDNATLGRGQQAERDLARAEAALARAPRRSGDYFDHWDETRLAGFRGNCAVLLGRPETAIPILEEVARNTSSELTSPYVSVLTDLAAAHGQRGDLEQACELLHDVLFIVDRARIPEKAARVRRVRKRYLDRWADTPAVRRLDDHLSGS